MPTDWTEIMRREKELLSCERCIRESRGDPVSPQPSWIGESYQTGGVAFVLQNPGETPSKLGDRDRRLAGPLERFMRTGGVVAYSALRDEATAQMLGTDGLGLWPSWAQPIRHCVAQCLEPSRLAWLNPERHSTLRLHVLSAYTA